MKSRFNLYAGLCAAALAASLTAACEKVETPPVAEAAEATPDALLGAVENSLASMNYGEAARLAAEAQARFPGDHRLHAAAARAQARLGDAEASAAALQRAVAAGLPNAADVLAEPAFDAVRDHRAFASYRTRLAAKPTPNRQPTSHIRAGDVEIIESADGDVIRAGDVVLDTRH
ncbi:hypothetical protein FM111_08675 [Brevundimonas diminuta 3F5N]|uniref:Uncharacterized protein n=1 Tax=Brevundimonas diminuta 3F5N TaxID=1255603 RepID=A0A1R4G1S2_BREDI|nr:hypothetical protein [Brevundimonas diminuta]SJM62037.1 hypothetical protein FM111_08675 [Brevundimonas diminuta 3F5N]